MRRGDRRAPRNAKAKEIVPNGLDPRGTRSSLACAVARNEGRQHATPRDARGQNIFIRRRAPASLRADMISGPVAREN